MIHSCRPFFILLFMGLLFCSCNSSSDFGSESQVLLDTNFFEIHFDVKKITQKDRSKDIIDTVVYISLETNDQSEFSRITQLEVTKKYYIILDKEANAIFFFNKDGTYAKKIDPSNSDIPVPFQRVLNFTIDTSQDVISFSDAHGESIYTFCTEGNFISVRKKTDLDYYSDDFSMFQGYKLSLDLFHRNSTDRRDKFPSILVEKAGAKKLQTLEYDPSTISYDEIIGNEKYFFQSGLQHLLFTRPYDYIIYKFSPTGLITEYAHIVFPKENQLPDGFLRQGSYRNKRKRYIKTNFPLFFSISDVYEIGDIVTFRAFSHSNIQLFVFDKSTNQFFNPSRYTSDSTTFFMPVIGTKIHGVNDGFFISSFRAPYMMKTISSRLGKDRGFDDLPDALKYFFHKGNNQNDLLVLTKFKKIE